MITAQATLDYERFMMLSEFFGGQNEKLAEVVIETELADFRQTKTLHWATFEKCEMVIGDMAAGGVNHKLNFVVRVGLTTAEHAKVAHVEEEYERLLKILGLA